MLVSLRPGSGSFVAEEAGSYRVDSRKSRPVSWVCLAGRALSEGEESLESSRGSGSWSTTLPWTNSTDLHRAPR